MLNQNILRKLYFSWMRTKVCSCSVCLTRLDHCFQSFLPPLLPFSYDAGAPFPVQSTPLNHPISRGQMIVHCLVHRHAVSDQTRHSGPGAMRAANRDHRVSAVGKRGDSAATSPSVDPVAIGGVHRDGWCCHGARPVLPASLETTAVVAAPHVVERLESEIEIYGVKMWII